MEMGIVEIRRDLKAAFESGLQQKFGAGLGALLAEAAVHGPHGKIDLEQLRRTLENDAAAIVTGIVANRADAPMLLLLRNQMIGSAIVEDKAAVKRWATEGLNRCRRVAGPWAETAPQWQWVRDNTDAFCTYTRQVKYFVNQL
jgi:hypothetical protein